MAALQALCVVLAESVPDQVRQLQQRVAELELEVIEYRSLADRRLHMWCDALYELRRAKALLGMLLRDIRMMSRGSLGDLIRES